MIEENVTGTRTCPVCSSPFTAYVRKVPAPRTQTLRNLYTCINCQSFWTVSDYDQQSTDPAKVIAWHDSVEERNIKAARRLFKVLADQGVRLRSIVEVGCGSGSTLLVAREQGICAVGFDINSTAIEHGRGKHGLDLRCEEWTAANAVEFDLLLCISVLEHIAQPSGLLSEIGAGCRRRKACAFISVPLMDRDQWRATLKPDARGSILRAPDTHVTLFSSRGMTRALQQAGATDVSRASCGLWNGFLARF